MADDFSFTSSILTQSRGVKNSLKVRGKESVSFIDPSTVEPVGNVSFASDSIKLNRTLISKSPKSPAKHKPELTIKNIKTKKQGLDVFARLFENDTATSKAKVRFCKFLFQVF
jgi:hypothetical protein